MQRLLALVRYRPLRFLAMRATSLVALLALKPLPQLSPVADKCIIHMSAGISQRWLPSG